jgi:polycomb protein EED
MYLPSCNLYNSLLIVKAFHGTGRYILSGGQDHVVNLVCFHALQSSTYQEIIRSKWTLPEVPYDYIETQKPIVVHYPHFSTSEVHSNIVDWFVILQHTGSYQCIDDDSVAFHGDLILSKAFNEHCIVLWQITGFDSSSSLPDQSSAPANYSNKRGTRSAFSRSSGAPDGPKQYARLLQFDVPGCLEFYMRFSLYSPLSTGVTHRTLAICNSRSKVFFWDLSRLEEYYSYTTFVKKPNQDSFQPPLAPPIWLATARAKEKKKDPRRSSEASASRAASLSVPPSSPGIPLVHSAEPSASAKRKYAMDKPLEVLEAHKVVTVPKLRFDGRQVAWSVCGRWCVVAATRNAVIVLQK